MIKVINRIILLQNHVFIRGVLDVGFSIFADTDFAF